MKFFKVFWAALLGALISGVIGFFIWFAVIISAVNSFSSGSVVALEPNSILKIELDGTFTDSPVVDPLAMFDLSTMDVRPATSLLKALVAIESARDDDNIEAIYLNISPYAQLTSATIEELREALSQFKESGKPIISYNDTYSQGAYYLSSVADKIFVQPEGTIIWQGLSSNTMFFKGMLDKLDLSVEVFRPTACRYKSAVEPFITNKMSAENRSQMQQLLNSMWQTISSDVALSRGLTIEQVNHIADNLECLDVDSALAARMVDGLIYEDQLPELFREAGADISASDEDVNIIDFADYITLKGDQLNKYSAPKVAIIYAEGNIVDGTGTDAKVYGDDVAEIVRTARLDDSIKAVVLRVNSPGGSALASDIMWRELELLRDQKPLIVSMGGYAASGGYYIAAPADVIVADRLTLTGSIGVFSLMFNAENSLKSKLGITLDEVETNTSSDFMSFPKNMSAQEKKVMLSSVDRFYERFTSLVSEGRNLPLDDVLEIAQGRVWSGTEAVELGLVDVNGGLHAAIGVAVDKAGLGDDYRIVELLGEATGFAALFSGVGARVQSMLRASEKPLEAKLRKIGETFSMLEECQGLTMYWPYSIEL